MTCCSVSHSVEPELPSQFQIATFATTCDDLCTPQSPLTLGRRVTPSGRIVAKWSRNQNILMFEFCSYCHLAKQTCVLPFLGTPQKKVLKCWLQVVAQSVKVPQFQTINTSGNQYDGGFSKKKSIGQAFCFVPQVRVIRMALHIPKLDSYAHSQTILDDMWTLDRNILRLPPCLLKMFASLF